MTYYIRFLLTLNGPVYAPNQMSEQKICVKEALREAQKPQVLAAHCIEFSQKLVFQVWNQEL